MGLGSTAKKIQKLADIVETIYEQGNEMLDRLSTLHDRVEATSDRVETIEREVREQRAIIEAIADEQGVDVDAVVADVEGPERDPGEAQVGADSGEADASTPED